MADRLVYAHVGSTQLACDILSICWYVHYLTLCSINLRVRHALHTRVIGSPRSRTGTSQHPYTNLSACLSSTCRQ
ncbi:unnamed protein product, partial [Dicrocoelium dendriticum]